MKIPKTNAMRLLDKLNIPYQAHAYDTADGALDGVSVAGKTGRDVNDVYKTLVCRSAKGSASSSAVGTGTGGIYVFCIPVHLELDLKRAAVAAGEKSLAMLPLADLLPVTGYRRGGCSPLGMKKKYPTFIHEDAAGRRSVLVSGGQIGLQIELSPQDLLAAAGAKWF